MVSRSQPGVRLCPSMPGSGGAARLPVRAAPVRDLPSPVTTGSGRLPSAGARDYIVAIQHATKSKIKSHPKLEEK